jgi:hypothetical protein
VLRRIFIYRKEEITGGPRKMHDEELHNLYSSPNISTVMRLVEHVARMGEMRNAFKILVGNPEGKRPKRRWKEDIYTNLK